MTHVKLPGKMFSEKRLAVPVPARSYDSNRYSIRIRLHGRVATAHVGLDGSAWMNTKFGQLTLADSNTAREFLTSHAIDDENRELAMRMTRAPIDPPEVSRVVQPREKRGRNGSAYSGVFNE